MKLITIDLETWWSQTHSLSKMSPIAYVTDPQTEIISCAVKIDNEPTVCVFGEAEVQTLLNGIDMSDALLVAHNMSGFDAMLLAWRLGCKPRMWGCTLAMARPLHAKTCGLSLAKLVQHYNLGVKDNAALMQTQGRHLCDFTAEERSAMAAYNIADVDQCAALFACLRPFHSAAELWQIDMTIRMLIEPNFQLDAPLLESALSVERDNKFKALMLLAREVRPAGGWQDELEVVESVREHMASSEKFSALLRAQGVDVPMKPSPTDPNKLVPALAKTDAVYLEMQDHENPIVAAAVQARLQIRSTLVETRIQALLDAGRARRNWLPVPLHFCGADTTGRWSGWLYNLQNLPRIGKVPKVSDALRRSIRAPKGHKIVVADQSGIELRVNHFLWKVESSMDLYREDAQADLYREFAAVLFDIAKEDVDSAQRQLAKICQLGLGFGAGAVTFQRVAKTMGGIVLHEDEARDTVRKWRGTYERICAGWKAAGTALEWMTGHDSLAIDPWDLCYAEHESIRLPSGRLIRYPGLRREDDGQTWPDGRSKASWVYADKRHKAFLTGPKVVENIVQALARDTLADNALAVFKLTGFRPASMVHDELIYVVPDAVADQTLAVLQAQMRKPPKWWPHLVTWSEGGTADSYADAK